jgi:hypothetical protein
MMLRRLQLRLGSAFSAGLGEGPSTAGEYLLIPTSFPVAPYYFYSARINRYLYD